VNRSSPSREARRAALPGLALLLLAPLSACESGGGPAGPGDPPAGVPDLALVQVASGLESPIFLTAPTGDPRLFIIEQEGRIRIVKDGALLATPFLDISGPVQSGGERGLLGMAFHPNYAQNGRFYVNYTGAGGHTVVERYTVSANPDLANPASGSLVLGVDQPASNHNGGQVSFGPDGYLYIALGDGGGAGDPGGHGQNRTTLLGALLRIDVDGGAPYAIPPGNPFANGVGGRPEIWGYGLRNPWRYAHDSVGGALYIADVGQGVVEEVNVVPATSAGLNFGWNVMEGDRCYGAGSCDSSGLTLPALVYPHGSGSGRGCSITGGVVYRGAEIPGLVGWYLYGDFCGGWVRALRFASGSVQDDGEVIAPGLGGITSFGVDGAGEVYVMIQGGRVYRFVEGS